MTNQLKTFFLLGLLTLLFVFIGDLLGGRDGMIIALVFAGVMNLFTYWFSDKIVLTLYRAREVNESEAPDLHRLVSEVSTQADIPKPRVYIMESPSPNAFATGRNPRNGAIAFTTGILRLLNKEELKGVIGHELAHIKNRDILVATIAATIAGAIGIFARMAQWAAIFGGFGGRDNDRGGNPLVYIFVAIFAGIAAMIIQMAISRSREYLADEKGARFAGNPLYLAEALRKLTYGVTRYPMREANPSTAHLFIVNPLSGGTLLKLFSTHPPLEERIKRLEKMVYGRAL